MASFDPPPETRQYRNAHLFAGNGDYLGEYAPTSSTSPPSTQPTEWAIHCITPSNEIDPTPIRRAPSSSSPFEQGRYAILSPSAHPIPLSTTTEPALHRLQTPEPPNLQVPNDCDPYVRPSDPAYPRNKLHFEERLIARDGVCAITGEKEIGGERPFELNATHIFPVSMHESWVRNGYGLSWIREDPGDYDQEGISMTWPDKLFSPQNGLLLDMAARTGWDMFRLTVDPDDGYRSMTFCRDQMHHGGKTLNSRTTDVSRVDRVSDECLRWHFHQSVLTVVRGLGDMRWAEDIMYENAYYTGEYLQEDLDRERESVRKCLEWESGG